MLIYQKEKVLLFLVQNLFEKKKEKVS
jgi:hypothetical protein